MDGGGASSGGRHRNTDGSGRDGGGVSSAPVNDEWETKLGPLTMTELMQKRAEFWETRVSGRREVWQTLRMAAEAEDPETGRVICESAAITPYDLSTSAEFCECFDERGEKYEVSHVQLDRGMVTS